MRNLLTVLTLGAALAAPAQSEAQKSQTTHRKLMVVSVDGLDWRYIGDREKLGLKIPNITRLLKKSQWADGVVGVWPTVTWPSHTSIITGVRPDQHGILNNGRGTLDPALSYWSADKLKARTLWQCADVAGMTTAAVTWPVTMNAKITWNLPEVFIRRNGGSMDLESVEKYGTPGLVAEISKTYPSFPQQWVDDRTRTLATLYLLKTKHPDLVLTHLVDLDSDAHDRGPYTPEANATLERTDLLIGDILKALPKDYDFALVSDHGFELLDHVANLKAEAAQAGITGDLKAMGGLVTTADAKVADWLRAQAGKPGSDIGREVPHDELVQYAPGLGDAVAAFEPAPHVMFYGKDASGPVHIAPPEKGEHGFWPMRADYRSVFLLSGPGIKPEALGPIQMISLKDRLAGAMGLSCPVN
ncbi:MAG TPA: ectonucleotide pyrophosphatase/phosphodiesterase [Rhizomicrobium sp.]|nr:ectonucleotide pyrophosphatase/phosphodiesterase [Rhizomicrobium sp.]